MPWFLLRTLIGCCCLGVARMHRFTAVSTASSISSRLGSTGSGRSLVLSSLSSVSGKATASRGNTAPATAFVRRTTSRRRYSQFTRASLLPSSRSPFTYLIDSEKQCLLSTRASSSLSQSSTSDDEAAGGVFFATSHQDFASMGISSPILLERLEKLGLEHPSGVQAAAFTSITEGGNVTIGAETGSGKTLAYLLPLLDDVLQRKQQNENENGYYGYDYARAVILVPNKELVQQVVRMAEKLCGGHTRCLVWGNVSFENDPDTTAQEEEEDERNIVRLAILPGGLKEPQDFAPFRNSIGLGGSDPPVDIVISTPASFGPLGLKPKHIDLFADVQTLVVDEADMLLDGGYIRALENCLMGFRRADKLDTDMGVVKTQHIFCAATLPDMGLKSVDAYLNKKFPDTTRVTMAGMHNARHYGLRERTKWIEAEGKKERMEELLKLLQTPTTKGGLKGEKIMVFLNSQDDVDGAHNALVRAGITEAVPYHAKISLSDRSANLDRFRRYTVDKAEDNDDDDAHILVCTDLASRGLDIPGVTAIVQLQFANNVVSHLHRMGRCGRAGNRDGRGIIFYGSEKRDLVQVVQEAELQQERMTLVGDVEDVEEEEQKNDGKVKNAFSRKRGFTKKRKKMKKNQEKPSSAAES